MNIGDINDAAGLIGLGSPVLAAAALWWLSGKFAPRAKVEELEAQSKDMAEQLAQGQTRFAQMDAAIKAAGEAANSAKTAADKALEAAEEVGDVKVSIATLAGEIKLLTELLKRIERSGDLMVRGHLQLGGKQS